MFVQGIAYRLLLWNIALILLLGLPIITDAGELIAQNIVSNPGFEMGEVGKLPNEWDSQKEGNAEGKVILTDKEAHSGRQSLFIEHTNEGGYIHPNKDVQIERGNYIFRFWAKSYEKVEFGAQLYRRADWSTPVDKKCELKNNRWTKFEFYLIFEESFPGSIQIGLSDVPGHLWLDDVELTKWIEPRERGKILIWDTQSPFDMQIDMESKTAWKCLPPEKTEEHTFQGDVVVENGYLIAALCSKRGKLIIYSKTGHGEKERVKIVPFQLKEVDSANISSFKILQNTDNKAILEVCFSAKSPLIPPLEPPFGTRWVGDLPVIFSFSKKRIIEVKPAENMKGISLLSPIEFAIVPSFISDALIFDPRDYPSVETLHTPSENLFLGLLKGENSMLVITSPKGTQEMRLILDNKERSLIESIDFKNDGESVYLAILDAPGIWHKEALKSSYLEKDVAIDWLRPFPAKWVTPLYEDGVKTTFKFKESKVKRFWRGGVGTYTYPVWFKGGTAFYHLGKKIPPKGESLVYFVEGSQNTPHSIPTPADILKQTLDNQTYEKILDFEGRKVQDAHRPDTVVGGATCGVTDKFKPIFKAGKETKKKEYIKAGIEDMLSHLTILTERANAYQDFAHEMIDFLTLMKKDKPELKPFLDEMENITRELITEYHLQKENIKTLEYAQELGKKTEALTQRQHSDNYSIFLKQKGKWTGMGGSLECLVRKLNTITRKLFQEAGYGCVKQPEAVQLAEEIRRRVLKHLRKPRQYEIWSDY